ncbi:hypothetical protein [Chitinophaga flava]|uniref:Uncharacterized protein n=1 Tax=Chitinophaga flava TaxID=2259036 RepID=A0A365XTF2_9BACT|nr:hypothetical protein [Chitinophaga flava]RBL89632.1 hypothetical protein DF182_24325 [Chitinophaga flava]
MIENRKFSKGLSVLVQIVYMLLLSGFIYIMVTVKNYYVTVGCYVILLMGILYQIRKIIKEDDGEWPENNWWLGARTVGYYIGVYIFLFWGEKDAFEGVFLLVVKIAVGIVMMIYPVVLWRRTVQIKKRREAEQEEEA